MTTLQIMVEDDVGKKLSDVISDQHVTMAEFMRMALMEKLSHIPDPYLVAMAKKGTRADFDAFLDTASDNPPSEEDKL